MNSWERDYKTIVHPIELKGRGLHSGEPVTVRLLPREEFGIVFVRTDMPGYPVVSFTDSDPDGPPMRSSLRSSSGASVQTVEHFLAAAAATGIWGLCVECDAAEMPALDGSSEPYVQAFRRAGTRATGKGPPPLRIRKKIRIENGDAWIEAAPLEEDALVMRYELYYPEAQLAQGEFELTLTPDRFAEQIAAARTFCLKREADELLARGFGRGANTENTVVIDGGRAVDTVLRFRDEPVRHKLLDLIGDLASLGRPLFGEIVGHRSGHILNKRLVAALRGGL